MNILITGIKRFVGYNFVEKWKGHHSLYGLDINHIIQAKGFTIEVITNDFVNDFISLTDIAKYKSDEPNDVIKNWMRSKDTIEFLGLWELLNNPDFKPVEFDGFKKEAGYKCNSYKTRNSPAGEVSFTQ